MEGRQALNSLELAQNISLIFEIVCQWRSCTVDLVQSIYIHMHLLNLYKREKNSENEGMSKNLSEKWLYHTSGDEDALQQSFGRFESGHN